MSLTASHFVLAMALCASAVGHADATPATEQELGRLLFEDERLSLNRNQSCATCHSLEPAGGASRAARFVPGFVDPRNVRLGTPVSKGSINGTRGSLNAPSVGYAGFSPPFFWDESEGLYVGGQFWNGRASTLIEQAKKPFFNPVEMAMPDVWSVVRRVKTQARYRTLFDAVYGVHLNDIDASDPPEVIGAVFDLIAQAISVFERSATFNKFNSKFDYVSAGQTNFTPLEAAGFDLFNRVDKGNCAACHVSEATQDGSGNTVPPMFTDFTFDNIGLPRNLKIPHHPEPDPGLGGPLEDADELGKHKVMSLRNIALTAPYGHNGVLATLEEVVHFYNTRDTLGTVVDNRSNGFGIMGWPVPEIGENVNHDELGNLGLSAYEERAIVAFLKTLTDDYPAWGLDSNVPPGTPAPVQASP